MLGEASRPISVPENRGRKFGPPRSKRCYLAEDFQRRERREVVLMKPIFQHSDSASSVVLALAAFASHAGVRLQDREMQVDLQASVEVLPQRVRQSCCGPSVLDGCLFASSAVIPFDCVEFAFDALNRSVEEGFG